MKVEGVARFVFGSDEFNAEELAELSKKNEGEDWSDSVISFALLAQAVPLVLIAEDVRLRVRVAKFSYTIVVTENGEEVARHVGFEKHTMEIAVLSGYLAGIRIDQEHRVAINALEIVFEPFAVDAEFGNGSLRFILRGEVGCSETVLNPPQGFSPVVTLRIEDAID